MDDIMIESTVPCAYGPARYTEYIGYTEATQTLCVEADYLRTNIENTVTATVSSTGDK